MRRFPRLVSVAAVMACLTSVVSAQPPVLRKPSIDDTIRANVYADNWFILYVNGELVAVDSIAFIQIGRAHV